MKTLSALVCLAAMLANGHAYAAGSIHGPISWVRHGSLPSAPKLEDAVQMGEAPMIPTSLEEVMFTDRRPYGELEQRRSVLVHFDAMPIERGKALRRTIPMTIALDPNTRHVICAFTPESADWVGPARAQQDIETMLDRVGIVSSSANYPELRSSIQDVLIAVWKRFGVDPSRAGQIIIRPRVVENTRLFREVDGKRVLSHPPSNVWIVEVLGTQITTRPVKGVEVPLTTLVAQFRDGDLKPMPCLILP